MKKTTNTNDAKGTVDYDQKLKSAYDFLKKLYQDGNYQRNGKVDAEYEFNEKLLGAVINLGKLLEQAKLNDEIFQNLKFIKSKSLQIEILYGYFDFHRHEPIEDFSSRVEGTLISAIPLQESELRIKAQNLARIVNDKDKLELAENDLESVIEEFKLFRELIRLALYSSSVRYKKNDKQALIIFEEIANILETANIDRFVALVNERIGRLNKKTCCKKINSHAMMGQLDFFHFRSLLRNGDYARAGEAGQRCINRYESFLSHRMEIEDDREVKERIKRFVSSRIANVLIFLAISQQDLGYFHQALTYINLARLNLADSGLLSKRLANAVFSEITCSLAGRKMEKEQAIAGKILDECLIFLDQVSKIPAWKEYPDQKEGKEDYLSRYKARVALVRARVYYLDGKYEESLKIIKEIKLSARPRNDLKYLANAIILESQNNRVKYKEQSEEMTKMGDDPAQIRFNQKEIHAGFVKARESAQEAFKYAKEANAPLEMMKAKLAEGEAIIFNGRYAPLTGEDSEKLFHEGRKVIAEVLALITKKDPKVNKPWAVLAAFSYLRICQSLVFGARKTEALQAFAEWKKVEPLVELKEIEELSTELEDGINAIQGFVVRFEDDLDYNQIVKSLQTWILTKFRSKDESIPALAERIKLSKQTVYGWLEQQKNQNSAKKAKKL
jgi:hypothetical protein